MGGIQVLHQRYAHCVHVSAHFVCTRLTRATIHLPSQKPDAVAHTRRRRRCGGADIAMQYSEDTGVAGFFSAPERGEIACSTKCDRCQTGPIGAASGEVPADVAGRPAMRDP